MQCLKKSESVLTSPTGNIEHLKVNQLSHLQLTLVTLQYLQLIINFWIWSNLLTSWLIGNYNKST